MKGQNAMTAMQRVLITLGHQEPDRVPFFLLLSMYGAKVLGMSIQDYFSKPENVVAGQLCMREKFQYDCYYTFYYASIEIEAWGGRTIFIEDSPPNAGEEVPIIGVVMSPFSLPVMQMGFEKYLELIYFHREKFDVLK